MWSQGDGPATVLDEVIALGTSPVCVVLLVLTALALATRRRALMLFAAILWASLALILTIDRYGPVLDDILYFAIKEGCIGPPHLFIALAIAICAVMTYGALRSRI